MSGPGNRLIYGLKQIRAAWDEASSEWKDQVARDFENEYLGPLEDRVQSTARAMDKLSEILARAKRECS